MDTGTGPFFAPLSPAPPLPPLGVLRPVGDCAVAAGGAASCVGGGGSHGWIKPHPSAVQMFTRRTVSLQTGEYNNGCTLNAGTWSQTHNTQNHSLKAQGQSV